MLERLQIVGRDKMGQTYSLATVTYYSLMDHCYYNGRTVQVPGRLRAALIDVIESVEFVTEPVKSRIGPC
jgi:hypothetical protein